MTTNSFKTEPIPSIDIYFFLWRCGPTRARASSFLRFLDHIQRCTIVCRTTIDERSARRRYQTTIPPGRFKPKISASKRPQNHTLDHTATGTGTDYPICIIYTNLWYYIEAVTNCFTTHSTPTWGKYFILFQTCTAHLT